MARIFTFALIAAVTVAALAALAALMRRRAGSSVDYDIYPPLNESDFDGHERPGDDSLRDDDVYTQFAARTRN